MKEDGSISITHYVTYNGGENRFMSCVAQVDDIEIPILYNIVTGNFLFGNSYLKESLSVQREEEIRQTVSDALKNLLHTLEIYKGIS